ncbi:hypothetical protein ZWY2020_003194 [Hordeum vulgare]|nr:hypothetical protein ZWY2020_003194 [Hordeum vulgare]
MGGGRGGPTPPPFAVPLADRGAATGTGLEAGAIRSASYAVMFALRLSSFLEKDFKNFSDEEVMDTMKHVINLSNVVDRLCKQMYQCIENDLLYPLRMTHNIAPYKSKGLDRASELHISLDSAEQSSPSMKCRQDEHKSQPGLCSESDQLLDATLTNEVDTKASTSQGSALLRVAAPVFTEIQSLQDLRRTFLGSTSVSFRHAPIFGLICGLVGFDSETMQRAYMSVAMRDVISAVTRLNLIGPLASSVLQHQVAPDAEKMLQKWRDRDVSEASHTAPLLDALQGCHAYMFSRLFCS